MRYYLQKNIYIQGHFLDFFSNSKIFYLKQKTFFSIQILFQLKSKNLLFSIRRDGSLSRLMGRFFFLLICLIYYHGIALHRTDTLQSGLVDSLQILFKRGKNLSQHTDLTHECFVSDRGGFWFQKEQVTFMWVVDLFLEFYFMKEIYKMYIFFLI